jgi:predicted HTH domain antitoxin
MPFIAVSAHKMLGSVAALRIAVELLEQGALPAERHAEVAVMARRQLDELETTLKLLITAPRELHIPDHGSAP